jgi:hypothetical protein
VNNAARRYKLKVESVRYLYAFENCMCCDIKFGATRFRHIHHVDTTVKGIICQRCNHVLGQESEIDLHRIQSCILFITESRENLLDRDNLQERSFQNEFEKKSSTTIRPAHSRKCKICGESKPLTSFSLNGIGTRLHCKSCASALTAARTYGLTVDQVLRLRYRNICDCCGCEFTAKNARDIHHIEGVVKGLICHNCNRLLVDESSEQLERLKNCEQWILNDDDIVWSA